MATLALVNGKIVTVDERFSVVQAAAIDGDCVTATGTSADILASAGPGTEVVDLRGRTVIPGLIDNHNHFVRAPEHVAVRLEGARSRAAALAALRRGAAALAPGQWLLTLGGWHEEQWRGHRRHAGGPGQPVRHAGLGGDRTVPGRRADPRRAVDQGGGAYRAYAEQRLPDVPRKRPRLGQAGPARGPAGARPRLPHRPRRRDRRHHPGRHDGRRPGRARLAGIAVTVPAWESG